LLQALHEGISASVAGNLSRRDWIRESKQLLAHAGWWGEKQVLDPATGQMVTTTFNPARLQLIYDTNTRQAAAQGQWERIQRSKASHPYLRYMTMRDDRVRAEHAQWDNVTLPADHPFFQTHFPPCGWRCRCRVTQVSQEDYDKGQTPAGAAMVKTAPVAQTREFTHQRTGDVSMVPAGVDPGFGAIPTQAARLRELDALVQEKLKSAIPAIANAAQYEGLTLQSAAATYAEKARLALPGNENKMPPLILSPVAEGALSGSTMVLDNASFHKSEHTRRLVEHAGCQLLYLPPYSPDLDPIEKLWANLKRRWRKVGGALEEMIVGSDYLLD
jgi:SPP1 gp7 family putative phage head morphogenesis protein